MSNSFSKASMNWQPRPQVCHPPPKDPPPEADCPGSIMAEYSWSWTDDETAMQSDETTSPTELVLGPEPCEYHHSDVDSTNNSYDLTVELATMDGTTFVTIVIEVVDYGPLILTAELPAWDGSAEWTLGPATFVFSAPTGNGQIKLTNVQP